MRPGGKPLGFHLLSLLPRNLFSRLCGRIADMRLPVWLLQSLIRGFAWAFGVDWSEATHPPKHYQTFNEFFTSPASGPSPLHPKHWFLRWTAQWASSERSERDV